ncbi:hypothetical protein F3Y22_tig00117007pilonHSYRG00037 [Hibiscus syriacus]|uniref:Uncharacterized protein n=1 Tax=Hibiscus syriacus TaxID=106335 RepID=A0A6A2WF65_HIBSY|nr:hypothetical protein F3Y22_tig00117007pilonHSYRG00037 [Hibiscus syriacus]
MEPSLSSSGSMKVSPLDLMSALIKTKMDPSNASSAEIVTILLENKKLYSRFHKEKMAVPLLSKKIVKKRVKKFKRPQSDRKISVKC